MPQKTRYAVSLGSTSYHVVTVGEKPGRLTISDIKGYRITQ